MKKVITISLICIFFIAGTSFASVESSTKAGWVPSNPFYFLEKWSEGIKSLLTFDNLKKAERFQSLAEERLAEARVLIENNQPQKAEKLLQEFEKKMNQAMEKAKQYQESGGDTTEFYEKVIVGDRVATLNSSDQKVEYLNQAIQRERERIERLLDQFSESEKKQLIEKIKEKSQKLQDLQTAPNSSLQVQEMELLTESAEPTIVSSLDSSTGKKETENGQVVRPNTGSDCNSKLYLCKIQCGEDIINKCNQYSASEMYSLFQCTGNCVSYQLFYGCSMEQGCDESCWSNYESACSPASYQSCLSSCESQFAS